MRLPPRVAVLLAVLLHDDVLVLARAERRRRVRDVRESPSAARSAARRSRAAAAASSSRRVGDALHGVDHAPAAPPDPSPRRSSCRRRSALPAAPPSRRAARAAAPSSARISSTGASVWRSASAFRTTSGCSRMSCVLNIAASYPCPTLGSTGSRSNQLHPDLQLPARLSVRYRLHKHCAFSFAGPYMNVTHRLQSAYVKSYI